MLLDHITKGNRINGHVNSKKWAFMNLLVLLGLLFIVAAGCQKVQYKSPIMKEASKTQSDLFAISAAELRLQLNDLAGLFDGTIEQAADRVIASTTDKAIERHALLWKINAIPIAYRALFQNDPGVAYLDTLVFSMQMVDYFETGYGRSDFGQWHVIALEASRSLEKTVGDLGFKIRSHGQDSPIQSELQVFASENQIERGFTYRHTVVPVLDKFLHQEEMDALQAVGSLVVTVEDISYQVARYMDLMTKQARWQAELILTDTDIVADIKSGAASLDELGSATAQMMPILEQTPNMVAREREALLSALRDERIGVLKDIDRQRIETLIYLTKERLAATSDMRSMQSVLMDLMSKERAAVMGSIDEQRIALFAEIESIGIRMVETAQQQSKNVIDHFFIRLFQLVAVIVFGGFIVAFILLRLKREVKVAPSSE